MMDLAVFSIGHARSRWLATRAAVTATNVANADTPGYKPKDVAPFESALRTAATEMGRTRSSHIGSHEGSRGGFGVVLRATTEGKHSGNRVSLETEMATLGETRSQQALATGIIGAFHRMLLSSVRG
jgi:flagellar basal-body rod protein FlgB